MKILFIMRHSGFIRNFESTLRRLCERGHRVHVGFIITKERHWMADSADLAQQLSAQYATFSSGTVPVREDGWGLLGATLRASSDYLRYLTPEYRTAPKLRERAAEDALPSVVSLTQRGPFRTRPGRALVNAWCRFLERCIPVSDEIDRLLAEHRPDLLLLSPLIEPGTPQMEFVRAARGRGIRTVLCVGSWDNLTNKGVIHGPMDLVTVWNEEMKREAVEFHGVPPERVAVTGAQLFDHWFDWTPCSSRQAFCHRVGLASDEPYLLYLCSSRFIAPNECVFIRHWVQQLRQSSSPVLRRAGVLVRPHPQNEEQWRRFDGSDLVNFAVYPPEGAIPIDAKSKADYFDSIYHSAAVVGVNTTAEIESAIVGRQVFSILAPEFRDTQEGTLHFHHLVRVGGGLVHVAKDFPDHFAQLDAALCDGGPDDGRCRRFVEAFVRPYGMDVPATPKLVEAIEAAATRAAVPAGSTPGVARALRPFLERWGDQLRRDADLMAEAKAVAIAQRRQEAKKRKKQLMKERARQAREAASSSAVNQQGPSENGR
jgi:hypothetical protein